MPRRLLHACVGLALLLGATAVPLSAQAPGTPESYVQYGQEALDARSYGMAATNFRQAAMLRPENATYHFLLASALALDTRWEEARTAFATALRLDPALQGQVDEWLATAPEPATAPAAGLPRPPRQAATPAAPPGRPAAPPARPARPGRPAAGPAPAAPVAPPAPVARAPEPALFAVGDAVEIEYRAGEWIPGVVTSVDGGACAYYHVRADAYGNGNPSNLGYFCKSVRAPTGVAPVKAACGGSNPNCPPTSPPPPGTYLCETSIWQGPNASPQFRRQYHGPLTLLGGGRYRMFDGGAVGRYRYDAATTRLSWTGGDLAARGGVATFGLDGTTPEITIVFGAGDAASTWQCGLDRSASRN